MKRFIIFVKLKKIFFVIDQLILMIFNVINCYQIENFMSFGISRGIKKKIL